MGAMNDNVAAHPEYCSRPLKVERIALAFRQRSSLKTAYIPRWSWTHDAGCFPPWGAERLFVSYTAHKEHDAHRSRKLVEIFACELFLINVLDLVNVRELHLDSAVI
jgi:hypothetical protein